MKTLIINPSYIQFCKDRVRLCTDIIRDGELFQLFYEYDSKLSDYLCTEVADPFLVAIIPYAMEFGFNIECRSAIGRDIFENFNNDYIPVLAKTMPYFQKIELICPEVVRYSHRKGNAVGTGVSCGVDSMFTIFSYLKENKKISDEHAITHLCIMNTGSCGYIGGKDSYDWFLDEFETAQQVCNELGLELVSIHTNLMEFYGVDHSHSGTLRMAGCVLAIDKLFNRYYLGSGYEMNHFQFANDDASYAFYTLHCVDTENINFVLTGNAYDRDERIEHIADWQLAHKYLTVCWNGSSNCSRCEKCLRTMGALYTIGKLNYFSTRFDVENFEENKIKRIAYMIYYSKRHPEQYRFLKKMKKNSKKLFWTSYFFMWLVVLPYENCKKILRRIMDPYAYERLKKMIKR